MIVEINGKTLLLGVCEQNISLIKELSPDEVVCNNNVEKKQVNEIKKEEEKEPTKDDLNELIRICNKYL